jgi:O-Antigen ligase
MDPTILEYIKTQQIWRANELFAAIEVFYFAVTTLLLVFVIKKNTEKNATQVLSPIRFALIVLLLVGTALLLTGYWGLAYGLFAFAFGMGVMLSFVDPVAAVAFLLANLLMRPWEMTGMEQMGFIPKFLGGLSLASWIFHAARKRRLSLLFDRPSQLFYALSIWFLISALNSGDFAGGWTEYANSMLISVILFILISNTLVEEADLNLLEKVLVLSITGLIAHALLVTMTQDDYSPLVNRLEDTGLIGNSNDLASLVVQALPIAVIPAFIAARKFGARAIAFITTPILLTGLLLSQSRGAVLAVILSIVAYFIFRAKNRRRAFILGAFCIPLLFVFSTALNFVRNSDDLKGSTDSRTAFLVAGLNMGARNPVMGVGFSNFPKQWQSYAIGTIYESGVHTAHNSWILDFAETGLPGLLLLVGLFFTTFRRAIKVHPTHPELVCAIVGYGIAMTFLSHTYAFYPYVLFALILAAEKLRKAVA